MVVGFFLAHTVAVLDLSGEDVSLASIAATSLSGSLPHYSLSLPFNCFQLPPIMSSFMADLLNAECVMQN